MFRLRNSPSLPAPVASVAVSLKSGQTVMGAMVNRSAEVVVLRGAILMGVDRNGNDTKERVDGDVVIPLVNIDFWQEGLDPAVVATLEG